MIYIRKGDEVYSRDEKTGETSLKEVIEIFRTSTHTVYHIWAGGKEKFKTTAYHPVYVKEQGWVIAINLRKGDTIETMDGFVHITKVERTRHEEPVPVYNFHVKDWVFYFVGAAMVYVHNSPGEHIGSLESIIKNGKVSIDDLKANPKVFSGKSVDDIAHALTDSGYDVTIKKSTRSKSGAQNIIINNPGSGKNIVKVQVSPGGGRHGKNPYVKISTIDQGKIKMVDGPKSLYKTDGKETATIIFSGGN